MALDLCPKNVLADCRMHSFSIRTLVQELVVGVFVLGCLNFLCDLCKQDQKVARANPASSSGLAAINVSPIRATFAPGVLVDSSWKYYFL
jgi:hypothetical protein